MKPILFHTDEIHAIQKGQKTVVRLSVTKATNEWCLNFPDTYFVKMCHVDAFYPEGFAQLRHEHLSVLCNPPYRIGNVLWVKETFADTWILDNNEIGYVYKADGTPAQYPYWGERKRRKRKSLAFSHMHAASGSTTFFANHQYSHRTSAGHKY